MPRAERLIRVFELSEAQASYILEMQLRRLTRFSRIELEKEQEVLRLEIEALESILGDDDLLRKVVSEELLEVSRTYGTPRRTVLLETAGTPLAATAATLEVADDPASRSCPRPVSSPGHPAVSPSARVATAPTTTWSVSAVPTTARGEVGAPDLAGAVAPAERAGLPRGCPRPPTTPTSRAATRSASSPSLDAGERALSLCTLATDGPGLALGTRDGTVQGADPEVLGREEWDVISLKDGDEVVGALQLETGRERLCFITSDGQLLHFDADGVRPQGRGGGGMAGVRVAAGEHVAWFGALDPASPAWS